MSNWDSYLFYTGFSAAPWLSLCLNHQLLQCESGVKCYRSWAHSEGVPGQWPRIFIVVPELCSSNAISFLHTMAIFPACFCVSRDGEFQVAFVYQVSKFCSYFSLRAQKNRTYISLLSPIKCTLFQYPPAFFFFFKPEPPWEGSNSQISRSRIWFYCRYQPHSCEGGGNNTNDQFLMSDWTVALRREATFLSSRPCNSGMWAFKMETELSTPMILLCNPRHSQFSSREEKCRGRKEWSV